MSAETGHGGPSPAIVFLGPSLGLRAARELLAAVFRPPARRGDIYRALRDGYRTIVLIDGEFHGSPSVWQREIVDALAEGAAVHGAASMGALRAAELHGFGMVGHGRIFEWYRDGVIDADDEVALIYGPEEVGYPSLSEPLVNIRATLAAAVPEIVSPEECRRLIEHAKALHFTERSFAALLASAVAAAWPAARRARFAQFARRERVDQKCRDAIAALISVAASPGERALARSGTQASRLFRGERLVAEGLAPSKETLDAAVVAERQGVSAEELAALRRRLSMLFFVADWARCRNIAATSDDTALARRRLPAVAGSSEVRLDGLIAKQAVALAAARAVAAEAGAGGLQALWCAIARAWLREGGIERPGAGDGELVDWALAAGPAHFGYLGAEFELIEALCLLGRALVPYMLGEP